MIFIDEAIKPNLEDIKMTIFEKAREIAKKGMNKKDVFNFFNKTNRDVIEYVGLFQTFGIDQNITWDLFEDWQET